MERLICPSCGDANTRHQRAMKGWPISECVRCGSAFSALAPPLHDASKLYDTLYGERGLYEGHRKEAERIREAVCSGKRLRLGWEHQHFFRYRQPPPGGSLLDIGCGTGLFLAAASQAGWSVAGLDVSREAAELGQRVHGFPVHVGDLQAAPFRDGSLTATTAWEVLEHIPEPRKILRRILRLLVPGGIFAGSVPNYGRPSYRYGEDLGPLSVPPIHLNFWTKPALDRTLGRAGFCDVRTYIPRLTLDLLRPLRRPQSKKFARFVKVAIGIDAVSSIVFTCRRPFAEAGDRTKRPEEGLGKPEGWASHC